MSVCKMCPRISEDSATIFWTPKLYIQLDSFFLKLAAISNHWTGIWNGGMEMEWNDEGTQ